MAAEKRTVQTEEKIGFAIADLILVAVLLARGVFFDTRNPLRKFGLMIPLSVPLLVSSVKKTEQAAIAVELRGFNLRKRESAYKVTRMGVPDAVALLLGAALIAAAVLMNVYR